MGLRINSNLNVLTALRTLKVSDRNLGKSIERLSTGTKINRGSDNPSGLIISERLRSQMGALSKAVENSQGASNMISVADASLQGISDLLLTLQGSIEFALNSGGASPDQISAEQNLVDQSVEAIDRIANTSRYGDRSLFNGSSGYQLKGNRPLTTSTPGFPQRNALQNLEFKSLYFADGKTTRNIDITVVELPQRGEIQISGSDPAADAAIYASGDSQTGLATLRITGSRGTQDVNLASGTITAGIAAAINQVAGFTGVIAEATEGGAGASDILTIYSADFGAETNVRVEVIQGALAIRDTAGAALPGPGTTGAARTRIDTTELQDSTNMDSTGNDLIPGEVLFDTGKDGVVTLGIAGGGQAFTGEGAHFNIANANSFFSFDVNTDGIIEGTLTSGDSYTLTVEDTGLNFQLGELPRPTDQKAVGIDAMMASVLGVEETKDLIALAMNGETSFASPADPISQGGFLSTLTTGNANDLSTSAKNALFIVQEAIDRVAETRAFLGAVEAYNIQPQIDQLQVNMQNIQASISNIRDLDYAEETANFTKLNIIFQAGISVLGNANTVPQNILSLLRTGG